MTNDGVGRPSFPKRAVVTAGMPYGNKELHFGHVGGVFVHADIFARFLEIESKENVIFCIRHRLLRRHDRGRF